MFIQRISCNVAFITEALDKILSFIKLCILPELVGKWFTRPAELSHDPVVSVDPINDAAEDADQDSENGALWCYCQ